MPYEGEICLKLFKVAMTEAHVSSDNAVCLLLLSFFSLTFLSGLNEDSSNEQEGA